MLKFNDSDSVKLMKDSEPKKTIKNSYTVFYIANTDKGVFYGFTNAIEIDREKEECIDVHLIQSHIKETLVKEEVIDKDDNVMVTNIINERTI